MLVNSRIIRYASRYNVQRVFSTTTEAINTVESSTEMNESIVMDVTNDDKESKNKNATTKKKKNKKPIRSPTALGLLPRVAREPKPQIDVFTAIRKCKEEAHRNFDETVDIAIKLGIDPRKPNQNVRGVVTLPHGTGKKVRVAVFAKGDNAAKALAAGATIVGAEDLVAQIQEGKIEFDRCIATPDVMPLVGRVARILGPRGLMPNPKLGTVTQDVTSALAAVMGGQVEFRAEKKGVIHAGIGKVSFTETQLRDNLRTFMVALSDAKPDAAKGKYIRGAHLSSTMGPSFALDIKNIDPSAVSFLVDPAEISK